MSSNVSASVDELKLGTALALSARPDPDNESMDDSHLRIGGLFAGGFQAQEIADHLASISSDAVIAAEVQKHEDALSVRADLSSRADPAIVDAHLRIGANCLRNSAFSASKVFARCARVDFTSCRLP